MDHPEAVIPKVSVALPELLKRRGIYPPTPSKKLRKDARGFFFLRYSYPTWPHHDISTRPGLRYEVFTGIEGEHWVSLVCSSYGEGVEGVLMEELWAKLKPFFEGYKDRYQLFEKGPLAGRNGPSGSIGIYKQVPLQYDLMAEAMTELIFQTKEQISAFVKEWGPERVGNFTRMASKFK